LVLPAAEAVCGAELEALQGLVDRSLVRSDGERLLQTVREYALERLREAGEYDAVHEAHARWLIELLEHEGLAPAIAQATERSRSTGAAPRLTTAFHAGDVQRRPTGVRPGDDLQRA
jgi:predicted ATPase